MQSLGIHTTAFTPVRKAVLKLESDWTAMKADTTASNCLIVNQDSIAIEKLLDGYFPTQWTLAQNRAVGKGVNAAGEAAFYCVDYYNTSSEADLSKLHAYSQTFGDTWFIIGNLHLQRENSPCASRRVAQDFDNLMSAPGPVSILRPEVRPLRVADGR
jgi:hypothetical protein